MHIPDGYLSPSTSITMIAVSAPFLWYASKVVNTSFKKSSLSTVGVFGAFSFLIMMFNLPLPGGTTGHAVGAALSAIVLGPWLSMISVTLALIIQAIFFGDGGILALGANIFNMAIVMSLVAYGVFRVVASVLRFKNSNVIAAGISGYLAINTAALLTAIELGIQPLLFHSSSGQAIYFPYPLAVAIPAMMIGHITIAGFAELFITAFGYSWLCKQYPKILQIHVTDTIQHSLKPLFVVLFGLSILVPLGLIAPGTAWGEWGREELESKGLGYIPSGYDRLSSIWKAPLADYDIVQLQNPVFSYAISAFLGVVFVFISMKLIQKLILFYQRISTH